MKRKIYSDELEEFDSLSHETIGMRRFTENLVLLKSPMLYSHLSQELSLYKDYHIYKEDNKIKYYLTNNYIFNTYFYIYPFL